MYENNIPVPVFWENTHRWHEDPRNPGHSICEDFINEDATVKRIFFGRTKRHTRGRDIEIFHPTNKLFYDSTIHPELDIDYYIEYIEPRTEYRIHVMNGDIILCQKKYFGEELYAQLVNGLHPDANVAYFEACAELIRNNETGWRFYDVKDIGNVPERVRLAAAEAVNSHDLNFGAVDIIWTGKERGPFILEINTAPGLRERNIELYANHIIDTYIVWLLALT